MRTRFHTLRLALRLALPLPLALTLAAAPLHPALAQGASFSADVSGYTAIENGPIAPAARVALPVVRNDGAQRAEASGEGGRLLSYPSFDPNSTGFTSASARGFASAEPGVLRLFAGVRSIATESRNIATGTTLPSTFNVASSVTASASFSDFLTVGVAGKAAGTPVRVPFNYVAEVVTDYPLGYPPFSFHAIQVFARFDITGIGTQIFSTESGFFPWTSTMLPSGHRLYAVRSDDPFYVDARVGDVLAIGASFAILGQADIAGVNAQADVGGFADGRNTAALWLGTLPAGMTIASASGHDYTIDPTAGGIAAPVPEPESYAMLLAGLAVLGLVDRRRRSGRDHRRA